MQRSTPNSVSSSVNKVGRPSRPNGGKCRQAISSRPAGAAARQLPGTAGAGRLPAGKSCRSAAREMPGHRAESSRGCRRRSGPAEPAGRCCAGKTGDVSCVGPAELFHLCQRCPPVIVVAARQDFAAGQAVEETQVRQGVSQLHRPGNVAGDDRRCHPVRRFAASFPPFGFHGPASGCQKYSWVC